MTDNNEYVDFKDLKKGDYFTIKGEGEAKEYRTSIFQVSAVEKHLISCKMLDKQNCNFVIPYTIDVTDFSFVILSNEFVDTVIKNIYDYKNRNMQEKIEG